MGDSDKQAAYTLMVTILEQKGNNCDKEFGEAVDILRKIGDADHKLREDCDEITSYLEGVVDENIGNASIISSLNAVKTAIKNVFDFSLNINSNNITIPPDASDETIAKAIENQSKNAQKGININSNNVIIFKLIDELSKPKPE